MGSSVVFLALLVAPFEVPSMPPTRVVIEGRTYATQGGRARLSFGTVHDAPIEVVSLTPLSFTATTARVRLRARKRFRSGGIRIEAGAKIYSIVDGPTGCRARFGFGEEPTNGVPSLVYDVDLPCNSIDTNAPSTDQVGLRMRSGPFRRMTPHPPLTNLKLTMRSGETLELIRQRSDWDYCEAPFVFGRKTRRGLEIRIVGNRHRVQGILHEEHRRAYHFSHIVPGCMGGAFGVGGLPSVGGGGPFIPAGTAILNPEGREVAKTAYRIYVDQSPRAGGFDILNWRGARLLCTSSGRNCIPGLWYRTATSTTGSDTP